MNRKQVMNLKLSEQEYFDDKGRGFKTYVVEDVEYKLYGDITAKRLDGETVEEYKVRRIFINEYNNRPGRMVWFSKNNDTLRWYNMVRRHIKGISEDKMNTIKETTIASNMGTFDRKRLEALIEQNKQDDGN